MQKGKPLILIVDDEPRYVRAIQVNLEASHYQTLTAPNGAVAVELAAAHEPDLILMDVRMPGMDGFEACRRVREFSTVPIIMLTALAESADKVKGLDFGADDYLTKPFGVEELLARVRAALRRASFPADAHAEPVFQLGELRVDFAAQRVFVGEHDIDLTPTEYRLLAELAREAGRVVVPEHLLQKVWGPGYEGETRLVWQAIHRLRQKIEAEPDAPHYIQTKPGLGYMLARPASPPGPLS